MALDNLQSRAHKFNEYADQISLMRLQLEQGRKAFEAATGYSSRPSFPPSPATPFG